MFRRVEGNLDIRYKTHEFECFGKTFITISGGDTFVLEFAANTYKAKAIGYGYDEKHDTLRLFATFDNNQVYAVDMLVLVGVLQQHGTQITILSDNERFFQVRVPSPPSPEITKKFAKYLDSLTGITVKGQDGNASNLAYNMSSQEAGHPDWQITFRATTNYGGIASLAKIATLTAVFPGNVFLLVKNHHRPEEFLKSHASATLFYCVLGVGIPPQLCQETLESIDKKLGEC